MFKTNINFEPRKLILFISAIFIKRQSLAEEFDEEKTNCPCTPPPSPKRETHNMKVGQVDKNEALVNISIYTVNPRSPEFFSKYDGV